TQPGETVGYSAADHVRAILKHGGPRLLDSVILNSQSFSPEVATRYRAQGAYPVPADVKQLEKMGLRCVADNLLEEHGKVRHNGHRLADLLLREFILNGSHSSPRRRAS